MTMIAGGAAVSILGQGEALAAGKALQWKAFPAGEPGFFRAPVLVWGATEAVLIDGGFTLPDGRALVEAIKATGRTLTTIYVSQSDPDYYFSLGPIKDAFPDVRVLAAPETIAAITANVDKKLATWSPQLGDNGPKTLADIVMPSAFSDTQLLVDGQAIEIVAASSLANRRYLWVPSLSAIFGGVLVFSGVHVWTADTAGAEARAAWIAQLDAMLARKPDVVVPGHMTPSAPLGQVAIIYTRDYLRAFEEEIAKKPDSAALIAAMTARYPDAGMGVALQVGAKVATGEMKWG
ncbi:MBL fold metallo-hydrolase [Sphingomonas sp. Leaf339]|uniref:MBL fold metallo-hydrolase n=1 Tax=Sphingomonas sp. Leaf339 TaxID=1736343 RepID=UPI000A89A28D|nr:MBL fold metallo-hydrolase [Sphingomonas sp. Leaf339]